MILWQACRQMSLFREQDKMIAYFTMMGCKEKPEKTADQVTREDQNRWSSSHFLAAAGCSWLMLTAVD